jgi:hypothetical protein
VPGEELQSFVPIACDVREAENALRTAGATLARSFGTAGTTTTLTTTATTIGLAVTLVEYRRYAGHRIGAAVVRRSIEQPTCVVSLWKLARDRAESLARANAMWAG